jgi:hypothetical protein
MGGRKMNNQDIFLLVVKTNDLEYDFCSASIPHPIKEGKETFVYINYARIEKKENERMKYQYIFYSYNPATETLDVYRHDHNTMEFINATLSKGERRIRGKLIQHEERELKKQGAVQCDMLSEMFANKNVDAAHYYKRLVTNPIVVQMMNHNKW